MDDSFAAGMIFLAIGVGLLVFLVSVTILVFYLLNIQRCFNAIRPEFRPDVPVGLIWLSLIPALGIFVILTAVILLSTSLKKEDQARGTQSFGDGGLAIGLAAVILAMLAWIPFIGVLFGIASLVCWIMHWMKVSVFRRVLQGLQAPQAASYAAPPPPPMQTAAPPPPQQVVVPIPAAVTPRPPPPPPAPAASEDATMRYASVGNAKLVCTAGPVQGMSFAVGNGVTIGRSQEADVSIPDPQISNRHAWVGVLNNQLVLRDLNSTNGTYLNDNLNAPINEMVLKDGDVVVLGKHNQMKFRVTLS